MSSVDGLETSSVDMFEEYIETSGWDFARIAPNAIEFTRVGKWQSYSFALAEKQTAPGMHLTSYFEINVPKKGRKKALRKLYELLNYFASEVPMGLMCHEVLREDGLDIIRWSYQWYFSDQMELDDVRIQYVLDTALAELEEFYPAVQLVLTKKGTVEDAYHNAIPEEYGRA